MRAAAVHPAACSASTLPPARPTAPRRSTSPGPDPQVRHAPCCFDLAAQHFSDAKFGPASAAPGCRPYVAGAPPTWAGDQPGALTGGPGLVQGGLVCRMPWVGRCTLAGRTRVDHLSGACLGGHRLPHVSCTLPGAGLCGLEQPLAVEPELSSWLAVCPRDWQATGAAHGQHFGAGALAPMKRPHGHALTNALTGPLPRPKQCDGGVMASRVHRHRTPRATPSPMSSSSDGLSGC